MEQEDDFRSGVHWREMLIEREYRARRRRLYLSSLVALLAMTGSLMTVFVVSKNPRSADISPSIDLASSEDISKIKNEVASIRESVDQLRSTVTGMQTPVPESTLAARQAEMAAVVKSVETRIKSLESALVESPDKALAVPLMRKDISDLDLRYKDGRLASKSEFDRLYSQQTWMLSGIGTVLLAVAGASLTMFIKSLPKPQAAEQDAPSNGG